MPCIGLNGVRFEDIERTYTPERWGYEPLPYLLFLRSVCERRLPQEADYSPTALARPARLHALDRRHDYFAEPDDLLWMSWGTAMHKLMENQQLNSLAEEELLITVAGKRIALHPDLYHDEIVTDFKSTSVFKWIGIQEEGWEVAWPETKAQVNVYGYGLEHYKFPVRRGQVKFFFRDWHRTQINSKASYPKRPGPILEVPAMSRDQVRDWLESRIEVHEAARRLPDDELPACTPQERWERPPCWAVKKEDAKRAYRRCATEEDAMALLEGLKGKKGNYIIEYRPGRSVRCEGFCPLKHVCNQWAEIQAKGENDETTDD